LNVAAAQKIVQVQNLLDAATNLNTEYQAKLRKDDLLYLQRTGEMNQLERKCESQSREIVKLVDRVKALEEVNERLDGEQQRARQRVSVLVVTCALGSYVLYCSCYGGNS
jgi:predicted RNase H-like nuclease (RuvC/YqgF family)